LHVYLRLFWELQREAKQSITEGSYRIHAHGSRCCAYCRDRFQDWRKAAFGTKIRDNAVPPECVRYMVDLGLREGENLACQDLMMLAAESRSLEHLIVTHEAGCTWTWNVVQAVAKSCDPDILRYALDHMELSDWETLMDSSGSLECVKVLYDKGYEQLRCKYPDKHPALNAVWSGQLEILKFVVDRSGRPQAEELSSAGAVKGGVEMMQYVREELGCVFNARTTEAAAYRGDLEALQYAHTSGAPWDFKTLTAAVRGASVACLEYAHTNGCPQDVEDDPSDPIKTRSLPILRYVSEHMDPAFASKLLENTAKDIACELSPACPWKSVRADKRVDWQVVMYLGRKLGPALPKTLEEAVATRKDRATTLAWVFWKAGKQQCAGGTSSALVRKGVSDPCSKKMKYASGEENSQSTPVDAEQMALWQAMAEMPNVLRERIAVEAHLLML
jgi:hypothetical protein